MMVSFPLVFSLFKALVEAFPMMKFLHSPMPLVMLALTVPVELHAGMVDHHWQRRRRSAKLKAAWI